MVRDVKPEGKTTLWSKSEVGEAGWEQTVSLRAGRGRAGGAAGWGGGSGGGLGRRWSRARGQWWGAGGGGAGIPARKREVPVSCFSWSRKPKLSTTRKSWKFSVPTPRVEPPDNQLETAGRERLPSLRRRGGEAEAPTPGLRSQLCAPARKHPDGCFRGSNFRPGQPILAALLSERSLNSYQVLYLCTLL